MVRRVVLIHPSLSGRTLILCGCAQHRSRLKWVASRCGCTAGLLVCCSEPYSLAASQEELFERIATLEAAQKDTVRLFEQIYIRQQQLSKQCRKDATKFGQVLSHFSFPNASSRPKWQRPIRAKSSVCLSGSKPDSDQGRVGRPRVHNSRVRGCTAF